MMTNKINSKEAATLLKNADNILILAHKNPDGDTLGSAFALLRVLKKLSKNAFVDCSDEIPPKYSYMWEGIENIRIENPDFVVCVDIADIKLLGGENTSKYEGKVNLCIDHHMSNTQYAQNLFLRECAATCEIIYEVIENLEAELDKGIADCIYTGLSTDTGCFRYSNVTPSTHILAAKMLELDADFDIINRVMFETKTRAYLKLEELVLNSIEMYYGGKCAVITITQEMFRQSGSNESECDGIASLPRKIEGVLVGISIRERTDGTFKVSLRTYEPINAAQVCGKFGGGGHARAAGCEFSDDFETSKKKLLDTIKEELESI
ncbi:MAG: DHH family phosphoesterase [Oscillospiraceae bacterium]